VSSVAGRRLAAARPEPEELAWAGEICAALADKKALEAYARAGLVRAGDFALSKTAALWKEIVTR